VSPSNLTGVFVPGLCCRPDIWEGAHALLPGVDVVALEWPWPERLRSLDDGAAWLAGEIREHDPDFVVAHSFAGVLALHLCGQLPQPPGWDLVIVETFLVAPHPFFRNHVWQPPPGLAERIATMLAEERLRFPVLREIALAEESAQWRERSVAVDASYIYGGRSGEYTAASLGELAGIPARAGRDIRLVRAASHFPMLERPEEFYAALRAVLEVAGTRR
jgi:pimeloyl-ACP methyl ester carboxylesterase